MSLSAKDFCAKTLKERILAMEMAPGQLLDEVALSTEFGISRTPLRELIQRLIGEGYLTLEANRGAKVASMDFATIRHFFQAAPMIYASIARLAAENAEPDQIDRLRELQETYRNSLKGQDVKQTAMHNHHFHEYIGFMAASPYLLPALNRLLIDHTRIGQVFYQAKSEADKSRIIDAAKQHDQMIAAFAEHRAIDAVELTLSHWELSRGQMEQFVSPDPLPFNLEDQTHAI